MEGFQSVTLVGNLTNKPTLNQTKTDNPVSVSNFGLAINSRYKDKDEVTFIDVTVWGKQAELCHEHLDKGRIVLVDGRLKNKPYTNKETGHEYNKLVVVARRVQFMPDGRKNQSDDKESVVDEEPFDTDDEQF